MKDIIPATKQSPILGLSGMGGGVGGNLGGSAAGVALTTAYMDDIFSIYRYKGNNGSQTVTNLVDLSTPGDFPDQEGGLVWMKCMDENYSNILYDTERGTGTSKSITSDGNNIEGHYSTLTNLTSFNNNGFSLGSTSSTNVINETNKQFVSWTFKQCPKFFDVVKYTGTGATAQTVSHNLGSVPGFIMVRGLTTSAGWLMYHRASNASPETYSLNNGTSAAYSSSNWNNTAPTDTGFSVKNNDTNQSGVEYIAYVFAHNAGGFPIKLNDGSGEIEHGTENVVSCGHYIGNGSVSNAQTPQNGPDINVGWRPQFVIIRKVTDAGNWFCFDTMRGFTMNAFGTGKKTLSLNLSDDESALSSSYCYLRITSTGFKITAGTGAYFNDNGARYVYIAIRGNDGVVGKPYVAGEGTKVFAMDNGSGVSGVLPNYDADFPVELMLDKKVANSGDWKLGSRLMGPKYVETNDKNTNGNDSDLVWDWNKGAWKTGGAQNSTYNAWMWRRHAGFDMVPYVGNGSSYQNIPHQLGSTPEMIWLKMQTGDHWRVGHFGLNSASSPWNWHLKIDNDQEETQYAGVWNNTAPTSTQFTVGGDSGINGNGSDYMAWLWKSIPGISKTSYYTGTGSNQSFNIGFQPRFLWVKCISNANNWQVMDNGPNRGFGSTTQMLRFNLDMAQYAHTDVAQPESNGFTVKTNSNVNGNGLRYIYYAHA